MGTAEQQEAGQVLSHAASCEPCGDLLTASLVSLEGVPSAEEAAAIAQLAVNRTPWQAKLARELAATKTQKPPLPERLRLISALTGQGGRRFRGRWIALAGVAATLVAGAAVFAWQRYAGAPEHLLAMAYSQSRTLELRIPEAGYSAVTPGTRTRGAAANNEPAPLLEARARLAQKLEGSPQNTHWLELQARADVLEERYDSAIDVLDRLVAAGPVTAELLTDAAAAYYQRGLVSGAELDRSTALDYLRRADEMAPTDPVILFNEAIVMEDRGQMMNAVEVWNRYITIERDEHWAAEGRRKLAALEQTLNRLKSHESRVRQMLATPEAMDALAADKAKLAVFDEELSSIQIDKLLLLAYPVTPESSTANATRQARGSPCAALCQAARRLLQATAISLELQHHDFWLKDLLSIHLESLPLKAQIQYGQAMHLLGQATRENQTGAAVDGARMAFEAHEIFAQLKGSAGFDAPLRTAAGAGQERASAEYLFGMSMKLDFRACRAYAQQLRATPKPSRDNLRYPWINAVLMIAEKACDDTPETRAAGRLLVPPAERLAVDAHYRLLTARVRSRWANDAQNAGDDETAERLALAIFRELVKGDPPPVRIVYTIGVIPYLEQSSPRARMAELSLRECLAWFQAAGDVRRALSVRMALAEAEMRIGAMAEAENQLHRAYAEDNPSGLGRSKGANFGEADTLLAQSMMERGDLNGAARMLDQASVYLTNDSDTWAIRKLAAAIGQLQLSRKNYDQAAQVLESDIRSSEGKDVRGGDRATAAEYAEQDHDLYAELAATWLAQGRPAARVLALWERFRMRSRGLPIAACPEHALDCEQMPLLAEQQRLGNSVLVGQMVLLDRILTYRMDKNGVTWNEKPRRRQDVLDTAQILERAVSSPLASTITVEQLGTQVSDSLLPPIPANLSLDAALLLEPDPMLQNLPWPVLPTAAGPLGLQYPLAEVSSILASTSKTGEERAGPASTEHALVVGASVAAGDMLPLPEALNEAQAVDGFLHAPSLLLGKQATAARVAQNMATATLFHFAGHAVRSQDGTQLLLAPASSGEAKPWVDGAFLRQHPPRACRLAVLSACATGQREASWHHPLQDIVETLSSLGVPEVVATRWQIDSEAAVPFMNSFYQSLEQGSSVAWALTAARRVQSRHSPYSGPYYWGPYYVTGREKTQLAGEFRARLENKVQGKKEIF